jgi:MscS family membrane protein
LKAQCKNVNFSGKYWPPTNAVDVAMSVKRVLVLWSLVLGCSWQIGLGQEPIADTKSKSAVSLKSPPADWAGEWNSRWRDGGAKLILEQEGDRVWGTYPLYNGRIEGVVNGRELRGQWIEERQSGSFVFLQSRDGNSFSGRFESGEWWTGARSGISEDHRLSVDQSKPELTLKAFMNVMNNIGPGSLDLLGEAALLLEPTSENQESISRLDHAQLLFNVLDRMTFRAWGISRSGPAERPSKVVEQAGSDVELTLEFTEVEGRWYLVPPDPKLLEQTLEAAIKARPSEEEDLRETDMFRSPRASFRNFILGVKSGGYVLNNPALKALNMSEVNELARDREILLLANYLKRTLDRISYVTWQEISDDPASRKPYVHFQHVAGDIVVARYETEEGVLWQFTPDTLRNIRNLYAAMDDMPQADGIRPASAENFYFAMRDQIANRFPRLLNLLGPLELWQWLLLAFFVIGSILTGWLTYLLLGWTLFRPLELQRAEKPITRAIVKWSTIAFLTGLGFLMCDRFLGLPDGVAALVTTIGSVLLVLTIATLLVLAINYLAGRYLSKSDLPGHMRSLVSLAAGVFRVVVIISSFLLLAHLLSIPYQGVIAGLGISGLAVALAAQPTLQNFLSGITLYMDKPVSVGDFCSFGGNQGTIEYIGMRSTRIRTQSRTVVSIPNSEFCNMKLENFAQRDRFLLQTILQLRYETTPDQLRFVLVELRKLLIAHPKILPDPMRVRFVEFGAHSLDIELFGYAHCSSSDEFQAIREDIYLRIMSLINDCGAQFAFPSAVHYSAQDTPSDPLLVQAAEEAVRRWRELGELPFPDFNWQDKAELSRTLDYPPTGSMLSKTMAEPFRSPDKQTAGE